jgi:hypothetical protein
MGVVYKSFFRLPKSLFKMLKFFFLGEALPRGFLLLLLGLDINTFNVGKMKIWPLHIHSTSSKPNFHPIYQGTNFSLSS